MVMVDGSCGSGGSDRLSGVGAEVSALSIASNSGFESRLHVFMFSRWLVHPLMLISQAKGADEMVEN